MKNLAGKFAVITGAGKGIGAAIAKRFLEEDVAGVALLDMNFELVQQTAQELDPSGERAVAYACNITDVERVSTVVDEIVARFGRIDILVNNAGITKDRMLHKMADEDWMAVLNVNLTGTYNMCRKIVPMLREQASGSIINISSTAAYGNAGQTNYSATKAGLQGFTRALALELGRKNVRANCVAPGFIETDMMLAVPAEQLKASIENKVPMHRLGQPAELAAAVAFLAGDDASWITGQTLFVSGGYRMP